MKRIISGGILFCVLFLISCGGFTQGKDVAAKEITVFHKLFNEEKFLDIFKSTDPELKKTTPEKEFIDFLTDVHQKFGPVISTNTATWSVNKFNLTTTVNIVQATAFEKGKGIETFTYKIADGKAVLLGYNITVNNLPKQNENDKMI